MFVVVRLYLDLETYRPKKEDAFTNEKIIVIGVLRDETRYEETSLATEPTPLILSEKGEGSEKQMIDKLMAFIREMYSTHNFTVIAGFNLLRFDIPILISRAVQLGIGPIDTISKFWHDLFTIDYFQELLTANNAMFKGLNYTSIVKASQELGLNPPPLLGKSGEISGLYENAKYDEIIAHLMQDMKIARWLDLYGAKRLLKHSMDRGMALFKQ